MHVSQVLPWFLVAAITDMIQRLDLIGFGKSYECITPLNHELMVGLIGGL